MKNVTLGDIVHDVAVSLAVGILLAAGLSLLLLLIGLLANGFEFLSALVVVRGGLLIAGSFSLFVCAGLLLSKKDGKKVRDTIQWSKYFRVIGLLPVLIAIAVVVLTAGSLVDYYLYF